jgi:hypothetical protein
VKLALLLALLLVVAACATAPTLSGPAPGGPPERAPDARGFWDLRGQVHCHSYLSHDSRGTLAQIAEAARATRTDFVVMTDHQTPDSIPKGWRGWYRGVLFVVGAEINFERGSLLVFPLRRYLSTHGSLRMLVARAHAQGALVFVAHPEKFARWDDVARVGIDGSELFNLHAQATAASKLEVLALGLLAPVRALLALLVSRPDDNFRTLAVRWRSQRLPVIAGGDAHENVKLFGPLGGTVTTYEQVFRTVCNHVLARERTEEAVVEALREGRSYLAFELEQDASGFEFTARLPGTDEGGGHELLLGEAGPWRPGTRLRARTPRAAELVLRRDGTVVARARGTELTHPAPGPGAYWIEASLDGAPWIVSNPIYLRP